MTAIVLPSPLLAVSTVELTIRMVVGLAVIGLLLLILNRIGRRVMDGRGTTRPSIAIRHQQRLDRHTSVTLLTAGGRNLLIGTSSESIVLLAEGDDLAQPDPTQAASNGSTESVSGTPATSGAGTTIDVRSRGRANPIRALQNKTVRRS
ncbi:MAG: flagellar biosynthetic protein FliO [Actinomycetota bacterium]